MSSEFWPHALMVAVGFLAGVTSCWYDSVSRTRPVTQKDVVLKIKFLYTLNDDDLISRLRVYGAASIPVIGGGEFEMVDIKIDLEGVGYKEASDRGSDELAKITLDLFKRCEGQRVLRRSLG